MATDDSKGPGGNGDGMDVPTELSAGSIYQQALTGAPTAFTTDRSSLDIRRLSSVESPLKLSKLDMSPVVDRDSYYEQVRQLQLRMVRMQHKIGQTGMRVILIFEGMDAAGKGGAIKRLIQFLDPRGYRVHSLGPPSSADMIHHYLRRFWMRLPKRGRICILDDYSWYGRLMLEHIEGLCDDRAYERAFAQVENLERVLVEEDYLILKFWIQISHEEQLARFQLRKDNPYKAWKLTPEDWRNNELWDAYMEHANLLFKRTNWPYAPWFLVAGNDKLHARLQVLRIVTEVLGNWQQGPVLEDEELKPWLSQEMEDHADLLDDDD
ncbi:polyphosphate kinase [bacterium]|nr:polyphosphate kinase [bacterium]